MKLRQMVALSPLLIGLAGCGYNQIQRYDENAGAAQKQI